MASDVCKHCTHAACLDVCPTGALVRTEFGTVVVQEDVCNGCGYCVSGLPVRRHRPARGRRPRLEVHAVLRPARRRAGAGLRQGLPDRVDPVRRPRRAARAGGSPGRASCTPAVSTRRGSTVDDPTDGVGGDGAFFLLLDEPEVYGLPPDPVVTTRDLASMWRHAARRRGRPLAAVAVLAFVRAVVSDRQAATASAGPRATGGRRPGAAEAARRSRRARRGPAGRADVVLRPADPEADRPWEARDIAGYLFLGGLAGASSLLGRRRRGDRAPGAGPHREDRRCAAISLSARRAGPRPRAARRASSTCCGSSSRRRR